MSKKTTVRMGVCGCLAAFALVSAASAAFAGRSSQKTETGYILRDDLGLVAVYTQAKPNEAVTVTDIETACLPEHDRRELENGIAVGTREELLQLLEDLGS